MKAALIRSKSCDPQLLQEQPSRSWGCERLGEYARAQHELILTHDKTMAAAYWRLGMALNLARNDFNHGQWTVYLESLDINKTRASKAQAIFLAVSTEGEVQGLTVEEAYGRRPRRKAAQTEPADAPRQRRAGPLHRKLGGWTKDVSKLSKRVAMSPYSERQELRRRVAKLIQQLQALEQQLIKLDPSASADDDSRQLSA